MPRSDYKTCRVCGRHVDECGPLSHTRLCSADAKKLRDAWNDSLHFHRGPYFRQWRRAHAAAVGAVLVDDILDAE